MANANTGNMLDVVDKRQIVGDTTSRIGTEANYADVTALRARLTAINGAYYTSARLDTLTKNDMVYAVRIADDAAGI